MSPDRPSSESIAAALSSTDLFSQLDPGILAELSSDLEFVRLEAGDTLMCEGDASDCMYAVISGRLHAWAHTPEGPQKLIGTIGSGECVGEMALLVKQPRSATVRAARDSDLVRLTSVAFERLATNHPEALIRIAAIIASRLQRLITGEGLASPLRTFALLPLGRAAPLARLTEQLTRALGAQGPALRLDATAAEALLSSGSRLEHQEASHRFVLYESDRSVTSWTRRCVREADRILLVCEADESSELNEIDELLKQIREVEGKPLAESELILLHKRRDRAPCGTERWLEKRDVVRHHHVCLDHGPDLRRLARIMSGTPIGLVLGGGGARGFAHIGILRAIAEAKIPIDVICGVSMGAIQAAHYAMGRDCESMIRMNKEGIAENRLSADVTVPLISLNSGKKFRRALRSFFGETRIEDLWLNYFAVSCNLSTAETVTHTRGSLRRAVYASNAVPGVLPPALDAGDLFVDGGIVNNQPADILKSQWGGSLIVVNVSPTRELAANPAYEEMPSPWGVLWHRLSPFHDDVNVPKISDIMIRTLMVGSRRKAEEVKELADYYLQPPLDRFKMDDYVKIDEIVEAGYRYAKDHVASWTALVES